jgi:hypothetical protein
MKQVWSLLCLAWLASSPAEPRAVDLPRLFPDYVGITLPPNVAPLNFRIQEAGTAYRVELRATRGTPITLSSPNATMRMPPKAWADLLRANTGELFFWDISVRTTSSGWTRFLTVTNRIAREAIDGWLAYRLHKPIFNFYLHLGIYQRDLKSFRQTPIIENKSFQGGCLNCHTPLDRNPSTFAFDIRAHRGESPMILVNSNQACRVNRTMGYLAWHPSGRRLAFSANRLSLFFHTRGETQEVYDGNSDLGIYHLDANTLVFPPAVAAPDRNENWPAWSPDGRYLYFSSAVPRPREKLHQVRYDLMRVGFDIQTAQFGQPELMISEAQTGLSVCQPKVSPDGRWLLVTLCPCGSFPIHQPRSDLWVMDLATRKLRRLEINSDRADTWHSWSSNSRWVVFSSKRIDGLFARPHFSYVDEHGTFHKPFVLPQEDPTFYGYCLQTFNVPELMQGPVRVKERDLAETVAARRTVLTPQGPNGPASPGSQAGQDDSRYQPVRE